MTIKKNIPAKRVNLVSIRTVKEKSTLYKGIEGRKISSPVDAISLVNDFIENFEKLDREVFVAIYLNTKNEPNSVEKISTGSLNISIVHPREVMKMAILSNSNSMIFLHNHPSGNPTPSLEDRNITERLKEAGELLGIRVLDHIVVGDGKYYSFKEEGLI